MTEQYSIQATGFDMRSNKTDLLTSNVMDIITMERQIFFLPTSK